MELGQLYRAATSDLAVAQRDYADHDVAVFLNQLVARSHATVYRSAPYTSRRVLNFLIVGLPRLYRESAPFMLASFLLLTLPALIAGVATASSPTVATWLGLGSEATIMQNGQLWTDIPIALRPGASSFIMQNNIRVSFVAFVGGLPFGLLTVYVMLLNGLRLGGVLGLAARYGLAGELTTFIVGHGVIELSVVLIAGGCGLMLGYALLRPGLLRRRDALVIVARKAARLLAFCVPLLVGAGLIEAFLSPSTLPAAVKWSIGLTSGAALHAYLWLASR